MINTQVGGLFQSDLIIQSAIEAALLDLRANSWVLNYAFNSLVIDPVLGPTKGTDLKERAIAWFLKTKIPVYVVPKPEDATYPCITIRLQADDESENTLGDINPEGVIDLQPDPNPALTPTFACTGYNPATGNLSIPASVQTDLIVVPCMLVKDASGVLHKILDVPDAQTVTIETGAHADFSSCTIQGQYPSVAVDIESMMDKSTYLLGVHTAADPTYVHVMYYILKLILLRYRQSMFEARNLQVSGISAADFRRDEVDNEGQLVYSRFITLTGITHNYWPKSINKLIQATEMDIDAEQVVQPSIGSCPMVVDGQVVDVYGLEPLSD